MISKYNIFKIKKDGVEKEKKFKYDLGQLAKDVISDFEGVIIGSVEYITGCDQYALAPKTSKGKTPGASWFDVGCIRIQETSNGIPTPESQNFKFELGLKVKDIISETEGIITGRIVYFSGTNQYVITPKAYKGKCSTGLWIAENRIEVLGIGLDSKDVQEKNENGDKSQGGGPNINSPAIY